MMSLEKRISLYLNSFPRTGNTFLQQSLQLTLMKNDIKHVDFISHTHDALLLLDDKINQISILRNPLDTITSLVLMYLSPKDKDLKNEVLNTLPDFINTQILFYIEFIKNVKASKSVVVIDFNYLINSDINKICKNILSKFEIIIPNVVELSAYDLKRNINANNTKHKNNPYLLNYPKDYSLIENRGQTLQSVESSPYYLQAVNEYLTALDYFNNNHKSLIGEIYSSIDEF